MNDARQIDRNVCADYAVYLRDMIGRGDLAADGRVNVPISMISEVQEILCGGRGGYVLLVRLAGWVPLVIAIRAVTFA